MIIRASIVAISLALCLLVVPAMADFDDALLQAVQGDARAQTKLGALYYLQNDHEGAAEWFGKAAEQGWAGGQVGLGRLYLKGQGVPKDYSKAIDLFHKAAEQGWAGGAYTLGKMYLHGEGVAKDYVQAYMWFNIATVYEESNDIWIAGSTRDALEKQMIPEQIAEAQRLTQQWLATHPAK